MSITVNKLRIRCGPHVSNDTNYRVMSHETCFYIVVHKPISDCSWRDYPWVSHPIPGTVWPCNMFQLFNVYRHVAVTWNAKCGTLEVFCYSSLSTDKIPGFCLISLLASPQVWHVAIADSRSSGYISFCWKCSGNSEFYLSFDCISSGRFCLSHKCPGDQIFKIFLLQIIWLFIIYLFLGLPHSLWIRNT